MDNMVCVHVSAMSHAARHGGAIVYAVCTICCMEHERNVVYIGIVDNDAITLQALGVLLQKMMSGVRIAWAVNSGSRAIEAALDPVITTDVALVDMSLEDMPGTAVCREIRRQTDAFPILGITSFSLNSYAQMLAQAGAQGIVGKTNMQQLCAAVQSVLRGETMSYALPEGNLRFDTAKKAHQRLQLASQNEISKLLSPREQQTVELCAKGLRLTEVAQRMGVSVETVKTNLRRAEKRTGASSKDQLIALWWRRR